MFHDRGSQGCRYGQWITARQIMILQLSANGLTASKVAQEFDVSLDVMIKRMVEIRRAFDMITLRACVTAAFREGLIS